LRRVRVIAGLPAHLLSVLAESTRERVFRRGSVLLREGEPVEAIHYVVEGRVRVAFKGRALGSVGTAAAIGSLGAIVRDDQGIEAVAETDVVTLEQDLDTVFEILEDHFPILRHVLQGLCRQLIGSVVNGPVEPASIPKLEWSPPAAHLDLVDRILILRRAPPFTRSSLNALAELARAMFDVRFEPGVTLWQVGEPARNILLVVAGAVSCTPAGRANFRTGEGWPLGALEALAGTSRWYEAVTETPVVALSGDVETFLDVLEDNFGMAMDYLSTMGRAWLRALEGVVDEHPGLLREMLGGESTSAILSEQGGAASHPLEPPPSRRE
jgi:CRP-like cAMP-binding protein